MITIFTSFNKNYGARALLLAESIRKSCIGDFKIVALVVDQLNKREEKLFLSSFDEILYPEDLLSFSRLILESHTVVEACTIFKPFALKELIVGGSTHVMYLDPDVMVVSDVIKYINNIEENFSIQLTPHLCSPVDGVFFNPGENSALKHGVFNLGYVCVANNEIGYKFADWWGRRILLSCEEQLGSGHFTDQKIVDLCPAVFPNVLVDRNFGLNVAPWNMHERRVEFCDDMLLVNDVPALFFHFSKINHIGAGEILRACSDDGGALEIALYYKCLLERKNSEATLFGLRTEWAFNKDINGELISIERRAINRAKFISKILSHSEWNY